MKFNFREALDNLSEKHRYYETTEGFAELFLRRAIDIMECNDISSNKIEEIYFVLFQNYEENRVTLMMAYVPKDKAQGQKFVDANKEIPELIHHNSIYSLYVEKFESFFENRREGIGILKHIENEIKTQGFVCKDITSLHQKRDQNIINYIKVTV